MRLTANRVSLSTLSTSKSASGHRQLLALCRHVSIESPTNMPITRPSIYPPNLRGISWSVYSSSSRGMLLFLQVCPLQAWDRAILHLLKCTYDSAYRGLDQQRTPIPLPSAPCSQSPFLASLLMTLALYSAYCNLAIQHLLFSCLPSVISITPEIHGGGWEEGLVSAARRP